MARTGIAAAKATCVCGKKMRLLGRHGRAFAVGNAIAHPQRGGLALQRQPGSLFAGDGPGVKQVQVSTAVCLGGNVLRIGQAGKGVFGGEAGNVKRGLHGLGNSGLGEVRRAGVAPALAHVNGDTKRFVAVALHVFQLAIAHRYAQATAFGHFGSCIGGAQFLGVSQCTVYQRLKVRAGVGKAAVGRLAV